MLVFVVMLLSACGDAPFAELGKVDEWVDAGTSDSTLGGVTSTTTAPDQPIPVDKVVWFNGWARTISDEPDTVIQDVWVRSDGQDAYVQTSPNEIAAALPGVMIPGKVPQTVKSVTSQLVYARTKGNLTNFFAAAFGFWLLEPYTSSNQVGQVTTLKVAFEQEEARDITDPTGGCGRFLDRDVTSCDPLDINGHPAWWIVSLDGEVLVVTIEAYRYEFTIRPSVERVDIEAMALSMVPLASITPSEATLAVEPVGANAVSVESSG